MLAAQAIGAGGSFTEIQALNFLDNVVEMGHDGPAHLAVSAQDPLLRGLGIYHGKRGWGVSVEFDVRHGPVTTFGLGQDPDGSYVFVTSEGRSGSRPAPGRSATRPPGWTSAGTPGSGWTSGARPESATTGPSASATAPPTSRPPRPCWASNTATWCSHEHATRLLPAPGQARADRGIHPPARRRLAGDAPGPEGLRLEQLLTLPPPRRAADRLLRNRQPRRKPRPGWQPRTSTPAGRPRWPASSKTSPEPRTQGFLQLTEIFNLEDQLAAANAARTQSNPLGGTDREHPQNGPGPPRNSPSSCRPGRSATPAPASRCSARRAPRAPSRRSWPTPPRSTHSPGWPPRWPCTFPGTRSTTTRPWRTTRPAWASGSGTINSNTFQDDDYKFGSLTHREPGRAPEGRSTTTYECLEVMNMTGSRDLKIWLADGTNYPGQDDMRGPAGLAGRIPAQGLRPARATTSGWCWSTSSSSRLSTTPTFRTGAPPTCTAPALGEKAMVCLDTGHHAPGTNIEFIVTQLLRLGKLGSFDFNSRFYADDDLIVGAADPFQLFRIMHEVIRGGGLEPAAGGSGVLMLDQCHNIEEKIPGQIRSVLNVQEMTARALLVDTAALARPSSSGRCPRRQRGLDGRLLHRCPPRAGAMARIPRPARRPDGRLRRQRIPEEDQRGPLRRPPGRMGRLRP